MAWWRQPHADAEDLVEKSRILHRCQCTWAFFFFAVVLYDYNFLLSRTISNSTTCRTLKRSQLLSAVIMKCEQRDSAAGIFIHEQYITFKNRSCCTWWNDTVVSCMWLPLLHHPTVPTCSGAKHRGHGFSNTPLRLQYFLLPLFLFLQQAILVARLMWIIRAAVHLHAMLQINDLKQTSVNYPTMAVHLLVLKSLWWFLKPANSPIVLLLESFSNVLAIGSPADFFFSDLCVLKAHSLSSW